MINKSNLFIISGLKDEISQNSVLIRVGVTESNIDRKHYLFAGDKVDHVGDYLIGYYFLKYI